jgi:hypothetical protein
MLTNCFGRIPSSKLSSPLLRQRSLIIVLFGVCVVSVSASAQSVTLSAAEQKVLSAFNPDSKVFSSITLSGATEWTAGSLQDAGSVEFKASADGSSSETWSLASQSYSIANSSFADGRSCSSVDSAGKTYQDASPACFRAVPWFAPWMSLLMLSNNVVLLTSGANITATAQPEPQLQFITNPGSAATASSAAIRSGTITELIVDAATSFISEIDFKEPIDSDPAHVIAYRVVFSDYRPDAGLVLPHHIQRFIQGTLQADTTITNITAE